MKKVVVHIKCDYMKDYMNKDKKYQNRRYIMNGNCGCNGNNNFLGGILGNNSNTEILLFLVVFLLLFTTYGRSL